MGGPGPALEVSSNNIALVKHAEFPLVDFALTEAAYVVVRLLSHFPVIRLPADQKTELIGVEKQTLTLVLRSAEGCMVNVAPREEK